MTASPTHPLLTINLNDYSAKQIEERLEDALLSDILALAEALRTDAARATLRAGLTEAAEAYVTAVVDLGAQRPETETNQALQRISDKAEALYTALLELQDYPETEQRLEQEIRACERLHQFGDGIDLSRLLRARRNVFQDFREMLVDLQVCAEASANYRPAPQLIEGVLPEEEPLRLDSDEELQERRQEWRRKSLERKLPRDHAALQFLRSFRSTWEALSEHPVTEGMYYGEAGQTVSRCADACHVVLAKIDKAVTRQGIVTALRKLRNEA